MAKGSWSGSGMRSVACRDPSQAFLMLSHATVGVNKTLT